MITTVIVFSFSNLILIYKIQTYTPYLLQNRGKLKERFMNFHKKRSVKTYNLVGLLVDLLPLSKTDLVISQQSLN